jgi:hypothetical protein
MDRTETKFWLAIACAEHVQRGQQQGFMQVCHGKSGPLQRMRAGDGIIYYSPTYSMGGKDPLQAFTARGIIAAGEPYQVDMGNGFCPFRRDVQWNHVYPLPIRPLLQDLQLTKGKTNWAYPFRFGVVEMSIEDYQLLSDKMSQNMNIL